jgi:hypothetical protein
LHKKKKLSERIRKIVAIDELNPVLSCIIKEKRDRADNIKPETIVKPGFVRNPPIKINEPNMQ